MYYFDVLLVIFVHCSCGDLVLLQVSRVRSFIHPLELEISNIDALARYTFAVEDLIICKGPSNSGRGDNHIG